MDIATTALPGQAKTDRSGTHCGKRRKLISQTMRTSFKDQEHEQEMAEKFTEISACCKELHEEHSTNKEERFYTLLKLTNLINEYDNIVNDWLTAP